MMPGLMYSDKKRPERNLIGILFRLAQSNRGKNEYFSGESREKGLTHSAC